MKEGFESHLMSLIPNQETEENSYSDLSCTYNLMNKRLSPPSLIFAIGVNNLSQPLKEAQDTGIPIIAVVDSDCDPSPNGKLFDYIIPGNDDSIRSYALYSNLISNAVKQGQQEFLSNISQKWYLGT